MYPDVIESMPPPGKDQKHSHMIKSHHNVGGLPKDLQFTLIEPLRELFKVSGPANRITLVDTKQGIRNRALEHSCQSKWLKDCYENKPIRSSCAVDNLDQTFDQVKACCSSALGHPLASLMPSAFDATITQLH